MSYNYTKGLAVQLTFSSLQLCFPSPLPLRPMPGHRNLQLPETPLRIVAHLLFLQLDLLSTLETIATSLLICETKKLNISATMHEKCDEQPSTERGFSMPVCRYTGFIGDRS